MTYLKATELENLRKDVIVATTLQSSLSSTQWTELWYFAPDRWVVAGGVQRESEYLFFADYVDRAVAQILVGMSQANNNSGMVESLETISSVIADLKEAE